MAARPSRSQSRRSKSNRNTPRQHCEVQCTPPAHLQPPRAGSFGARKSSRSARSRSQDLRKRAILANGQAQEQKADTVELKTCAEVQEEEVTSEPKVQSHSAMIAELRAKACDIMSKAYTDGSLQRTLQEVLVEGKPQEANANEDDDFCEATAFISGLLEVAVEDYSEEKTFEILHMYEAPQVFDVPEPPIPEESEEDLIEANEEVKFAFSEAALHLTQLAFEEAEVGFVNGGAKDSYDIDDCEDDVSVLSYTDESDADQPDLAEVTEQVAEELVWTVPDESAALANIKNAMKNTLEVTCQNGEFGNMLLRVREARQESWPLPPASTLPPCTRPAFARKMQPTPEGAPVMEEEFPFDCLPPTTAVAKPAAPPSEAAASVRQAVQAHERWCREVAASTLQLVYNQAAERLAAPVQKPSPMPEIAKEKSVNAAIMQARAVLMRAAGNGTLGTAIDEVINEKQEDTFASVCAKMRSTFVNAMEDGRLQTVLREQKFEKTCNEAREVLVDAASSGRLEAAIREVTKNRETSKDESAVPEMSPMAPSAPAAPPGSPTRRRFSGARIVVPSSAPIAAVPAHPQPAPPSAPRPPSGSCSSPRKARAFTSVWTTTTPTTPTPAPPTVRPTDRQGARPTSRLTITSGGLSSDATSAPILPQTPKTPVQPAGSRPGFRRPARASTANAGTAEPAEASVAEQVSSGPTAPLRRLSSKHTEACLSARGSGPTALQLDLGDSTTPAPAAPAAPSSGSMTPREPEETFRLSKGAPSGTGLLPALPSDSVGSVAWTLGLQHSAAQQKVDPLAKARASSMF